MFSDFLLTVDFDRTLTAPDSTIPQRNIDAIRYFMDHGGVFTVNTGRSIPMAARNILGKVPVNAPLLLYNGSGDYDTVTGELTRAATLPMGREFLQELQQRFPRLNIEEQGIHAHYLMRHDAGWEAYNDHNNCAWSYDLPHTPFIKAAIYGQFREPTLASMYDATEEELRLFDEAIAYVEEKYADQLVVFRACPRIADIHAAGCSKLASARMLQKQLGRKHLVCVGDAENDLTMLEGADFAYCPADGIVADRFETVCDCAAGAVADVIYKKIPEIIKNTP